MSIEDFAEKNLGIKLLPFQVEMIKAMENKQFKDTYYFPRRMGVSTVNKVFEAMEVHRKQKTSESVS